MASTYLSRTPAGAGNRKTWTWSGWVKRSKLSATQTIFSAQSTTTANQIQFYFNSNDTIILYQYSSSGAVTDIFYSTEVQFFRDTSAWYHVVLAVDTTQATNTNRVKLYINGNSNPWLIGNPTHPSQNLDTYINATNQHRISANPDSANYFDGSMASVYFIDGQALTPSSFGETDATTGIWKPKAYTGSYGTNGFFLKFENSGSLGLDSSGNGNNFTVNGTPTQTVDTPSNVFCTMNSLDNSYFGATFSNGNLRVVTNAGNENYGTGTFGVSAGKWYWEVKVTSSQNYEFIGITDIVSSTTSFSAYSSALKAISYYAQNGNYYTNASSTAYGNSYTTGDIIGVALDITNGKLYFSKNGTFQNSGVPTSGATGTGAISISSSPTNGVWFPQVGEIYTGSSTMDLNFGNGFFGTTAISSPYSDGAGLGKFQYQPPTGYYALCTKNINVYG